MTEDPPMPLPQLSPGATTPAPSPPPELLPKTKGTRGAGQGGPRRLLGDIPDGHQQLWGLRKSHISVLSLALPLCLQPSSDYRKVEERRLAAGKHFSWQATVGS